MWSTRVHYKKKGRVDLVSGPSWLREWTELTSWVDRVDLVSGPSWLGEWTELTSWVDRVDLVSGPSWLREWTVLTSWVDRVDFASGPSWLRRTELTHSGVLMHACIRSKGGWNNKPNCLHLRFAPRQMLMRNAVTASKNANCLDFIGNNTIITFFFFTRKHWSKRPAKGRK